MRGRYSAHRISALQFAGANWVCRYQRGSDATNQGFKSFIPDGTQVCSKFLYWWLRCHREYLQGLGNGATFKEISKSVISEVHVPLPPLAEQRRITEIFDTADALAGKGRAFLGLLDALLHAVFVSMFGDPGSSPDRWNKRKIGAVVSEFRGGANLAPEDFSDSGFPVLHKGAIRRNGAIVLDGKKKTFVSERFASSNIRARADRQFVAVTLRDLVPTGPSIGLAAALRDGPFDEYVLAQGAYAFILDPQCVLPEYFVCLSNIASFRNTLRKYAVGTTQIHIRTPVYMDIPIPIPPPYLQHEFAAKSRAIARLRESVLDSLSEGEQLFRSLEARAFRGDL